jgi:hypothetical protein
MLLGFKRDQHRNALLRSGFAKQFSRFHAESGGRSLPFLLGPGTTSVKEAGKLCRRILAFVTISASEKPLFCIKVTILVGSRVFMVCLSVTTFLGAVLIAP